MNGDNPLKIKIKKKFGNVTDFCKEMNCSRNYFYKIFNGERNGSAEFWAKAQRVLRISDKDMWKYIRYSKREVNLINGRKQKNNND